MRKTKIVATVGPACSDPERLKELILKGVNVFRLNMSHAEHDKVRVRIDDIRRIAKELKRHVAILMDIQGPKIRTGIFKDGEVQLESGQKFVFDQLEEEGDSKRVYTTYNTMYQDVTEGDQILLDDGKMEVLVTAVEGTKVVTEVITGGILKNKKGMNLPGVKIGLPPLTQKDMEDVAFGCELDIDFMAISFVQRAADVELLRNILRKNKRDDVQIISKIEKPVAVQDIEKIIASSDGIMIARGDLGVELSPEKVPMVQKRICELCNKMGRPVITATQMLDSMERNPKPTRAEASDVANAILDGTDAVMLSGETATGKYPVRAVEMMRKIILETEREMGYSIRHWTFFEFPEEANINEAISYSACQISKAISAQLICCFTSEGKQPRRISKFRPEQPVVGVTYEARVANRISLYWGVVAITVKGADILDDEIIAAEQELISRQWAVEGDKVVITSGIPIHISGSTNVVKVHKMSDLSCLEKSYRVGR